MAGVNALIQRLERMASGQVKAKIAAKVADECHAQCVLGFRQQRNPYGTPWAPRKKVKGWAALAFGHIDNGHPLLDDTGAMLNSLTARTSGERITMRIKGYAKFHQTGTRYMVAREIFPDPNKGMGLWSQPIQDAALSAVRELMK